MAWFFNFCSPYLPNDQIINIHRKFQTACLVTLLIVYSIMHIFYKFFGPKPKNVNEEQQQSIQVDSESNNEKIDEDSDDKYGRHDKSRAKLNRDANSSFIAFKSPNKKKRKNHKQKHKSKQQKIDNKSLVTILQIQNYFPIVFGHFGICLTFTIMYSPFAEQSIAAFLYVISSIILIILNSKRKKRSINAVWGFMCFLNIYLTISGLLEVGQSNYNKKTSQCYSVTYEALY